MAFDAHKNFAVSTVVTPPDPALLGDTIAVALGHGARFPAPPFNVVISPSGVEPTPANAEVARVTAKNVDVFTIARSQEDSAARSIITGDRITLAITAKTLTDIEAATAGGNGGSQPGALTLLGPFAVDFDTPNFINPADNGIETLAIPAGTLVVSVVPLGTAAWIGAVAVDAMYVTLAPSSSSSGPPLGAWQMASEFLPEAQAAGHVVDASITGGSATALSVEYQSTPALALVDCHLIVGFFPAGPITAGSLDLYAIIATP